MGARDFEDRGYALNATIESNEDGSTTGAIFANTPVAITVIVAGTVLGLAFMLTQDWRPPDPLALAEGAVERLTP
jgi:hypothetical protein